MKQEAVPPATPLITDYASLIQALVWRKLSLGLTNLEVDERGNMPSGYFSKLCCGQRKGKVNSLDKALDALDLVLIAVPKPRSEILALAQIPENAIRFSHLDADGKDIRRKIWGKMGRTKQIHLQSPRQRRAIAKKASIAASLSRKRKRLLAKAKRPKGVDADGSR